MTPTAYLASELEPVLTAAAETVFTAVLMLAAAGLAVLVIVELALRIRRRLAARRRVVRRTWSAARVRHGAAQASRRGVPSRSIVTHSTNGRHGGSTMRLTGAQS